MKKHLLKSLLALALVLICGNAWGEDVTPTITLSDGSYNESEATITWDVTGLTITQSKGSGSSAVSSSYVSAPRVYKGHILSFVAKTDYKIKSISIKCNSTYYGNSMTAGTAVSGNTVTDNTTDVSRTWATTSGGTHTVSSVSSDGLSEIYIQNVASSTNTQLRFTAISVTLEYSGSSLPVSTPTFSIGGGLYVGTQSVELACATDGATIYYTTDGTEASTTSSVYSAAIEVSATTTINVLAAKSGMTDATASATYTIVPTPTVDAKSVNSNYYTKVTSLSELENGDAVLIVSGSNAMSTTESTYRGIVSVTPSDGVINAPGASAQKLVFVKETVDGLDYYFLYTGSGYLYAPNVSSNQLKTEADADENAVITTFSVSEGNATIVFNNTRYLKFNSDRFSTYTTSGTVELYKEVTAPAQLPSAPVFSAAKVTAAKKVDGTFEDVSFPTLTTATGYDGTATYASDNTSVATVDASTGAVTLVGVGTATITATAPETTGFIEGTASYEISVYQIEDGMFYFSSGNYLSGQEASTNTNEVNEKTWTAGNVTLVTAGRNVWYGGSSLRLYGASGSDAAGSITISVPEDYRITKIIANGGAALTADTGFKDGVNWTGFATSVVLTRGESNSTLTNVQVFYTEKTNTSTSVTVSSYEYATASFASQVAVPSEGATVYAVTGVEGDVVQMTALAAGTVLPPSTGVIIYKTGGGDVTFNYTNATPETVTSVLKTSGMILTTDYILSVSENDEFGFCHSTVNQLCPTGKAFLRIESSTPAPFLRIGGTTRIANAEAEAETATYYDLIGRRVEQPQRGIYIVGGRKVMVK